MLDFKIEGVITHIFEKEFLSTRFDENKAFKKQKVVIRNENGQEYTLTFIEEKTALLKYCNIGTKISVDSSLKGRKWEYYDKIYSENQIIGYHLNIISTNQFFSDYFSYKGEQFNIKKSFTNNNLQLSIQNINTKAILQLTDSYNFPDRTKNENNVVLKNELDKEIIIELQKQGIIKDPFYFKNDTIEGFFAEVIVLHLFTGNFLFNKTPIKDSRNTDLSFL